MNDPETRHEAPAQGAVLKGVDLLARPWMLVQPAQQRAVAHRALPLSDSAQQAAEFEAERAERQRGHAEGYAQGQEEGRAHGHAQGYKRGEEEGLRHAEATLAQAQEHLAQAAQKAREQLEETLQVQTQALHERAARLDALLRALPEQIAQRLALAEDDALALVHACVCRLLGEQAAQPQRIRAQLMQALREMKQQTVVAVHLHPDDLAALETLRQDLPAALTSPGIEWIADAHMTLGGCILVSPQGGLDARLETQMQALRELLLQTRVTRAHEAAVAAPATSSHPEAAAP